MEQRKEFINDYLKEDVSFKSLCDRYGISEKTGHKWKNRFTDDGYRGLEDLSRRPKSCRDILWDEDIITFIFNIREKHPTWGPKKISVLTNRMYPDKETPSVSSIHRVLEKAGKINKQKIKKASDSSDMLRNRIEPEKPNDVWTVDFKGWWYSDKEKCLPLTIRDLWSRYLLEVRLMRESGIDALKPVFERLFYDHGLPEVIRSDNGPPFAAMHSPLELTKLSAWWMVLGILPDRIDPGTPTQNGSHERMHGDLSREIEGRIPGGIRANQIAIDAWRDDYNKIRPHEALGMITPAEVYRNSRKKYVGTPDDIEYPAGFLPRKVDKHGHVDLYGTTYRISQALHGWRVGLQERDEEHYNLWLGDFAIGVLDLRLSCFHVTFRIKSH